MTTMEFWTWVGYGVLMLGGLGSVLIGWILWNACGDAEADEHEEMTR